MKKKLPSYYWDSSIFLMILKEETCHGEGVLEAAVEILRSVEKQEAAIVTSSIVLIEVLPSKSPPDVYERFEAWMQWPNMLALAADLRICQRAAQIRDSGVRAVPKISLSTPDVIHMATALSRKDHIIEIQSVDSDFWKGLPHFREVMKVAKPHADQLQLPISGTDAAGEEDDEDVD
jgi:predicted nucleic acid-binding protein